MRVKTFHIMSENWYEKIIVAIVTTAALSAILQLQITYATNRTQKNDQLCDSDASL